MTILKKIRSLFWRKDLETPSPINYPPEIFICDDCGHRLKTEEATGHKIFLCDRKGDENYWVNSWWVRVKEGSCIDYVPPPIKILAKRFKDLEDE